MKVFLWLVVCALLFLGMYNLGRRNSAPQNGSFPVATMTPTAPINQTAPAQASIATTAQAAGSSALTTSQAQEDSNVVAEYEDGLKLVQTLKDRFAGGSFNDEPETSELVGYVIYIRDHAQRASPDKQATYASYAQYLDNATHYYTDKSYQRPL